MGAAITIVRKGLQELPRYGPLWFGLLRICESQDALEERQGWIQGKSPLLTRVTTEASAAIRSISKELIWKIHFEVACVFERAVDVTSAGSYYKSMKPRLDCIRSHFYDEVRHNYIRSLLACPQNLRWKVLIVAARLEILCSNFYRARKFLGRAWIEVPEKSKAAVFLECARLEEYIGNVPLARDILARAQAEARGDWKVFMEAVLIELRHNNLKAAAAVARDALSVHPGAGRLWSLLIHLAHRCECLQFDFNSIDIPSKRMALLCALSRCPKSGEIWCEAARIHLNPLLLDSFDLTLAQRYLGFAAQFTPQYGDTFIEILRVEFLIRAVLFGVLDSLNIDKSAFIRAFLAEDNESDIHNFAAKSAHPPTTGGLVENSMLCDEPLIESILDHCVIDENGMDPKNLKYLLLR